MPVMGTHLTANTKIKMSGRIPRNKGKKLGPLSENIKQKMSLASKHTKHTEAFKQRMCARLLGHPNWNISKKRASVMEVN